MKQLLYFIPIISIIGIFFTFHLINIIKKQKIKNNKIIEISSYIHNGSKTFLFSEYKIMFIFIILLFIILKITLKYWIIPISFLIGTLFSSLSGYCGMQIATNANAKTAYATQKNNIKRAFFIAFYGGIIMGIYVVCFGYFGINIFYILTKNINAISSFGFGASFVALFSRVGGGIYTKAADIGADLVGKIEKNIPEDDPKNPAVIADNVGDNVGDIAGMGADLFESYVSSIIATITLGYIYFKYNGILFPLCLIGIGILSSIISIIIIKKNNNNNPNNIFKINTYLANIIVLILTPILSYVFFGNIITSISIISGLIVGIMIGISTEYYTSSKYKPVKKIINQSKTGTATNIISGISIGMNSTILPILFIVTCIFIVYKFNGLYGIALSSIGMLSTVCMTIAIDAYGPIVDNASGIIEMSKISNIYTKNIANKLDSIGNTTAAIGKGFAIGSAALTSLALFVSYSKIANLNSINILEPNVIIGLFIGGMLPFIFSSLTMNSVSIAANKIIKEVRKQFKTIPGIINNTQIPNYSRCISISTNAALKEMILPGIIAIIIPLIVGKFLGVNALGGILSGSLITGTLIAIFMSNSGGAWDNAKKYIENKINNNNKMYNKETYNSSIIGDTVGDPFKDTSGPSINILIKLMSIISIVFVPLFL